MRNALMVLSTLVLVGCARDNDQPAADSPAASETPATASPATAPATAPAALTLADFAGRWTIQFVNASDSVLGTYELNATGDSAAWTLQPPGSEPIPVGTAVQGDSLLFDAGTYKSSAPPSVEITTHGAGRLEGGRLVGWFESRYAKAVGDTVVRGRLRGTRRP